MDEKKHLDSNNQPLQPVLKNGIWVCPCCDKPMMWDIPMKKKRIDIFTEEEKKKFKKQ